MRALRARQLARCMAQWSAGGLGGQVTAGAAVAAVGRASGSARGPVHTRALYHRHNPWNIKVGPGPEDFFFIEYLAAQLPCLLPGHPRTPSCVTYPGPGSCLLPAGGAS